MDARKLLGFMVFSLVFIGPVPKVLGASLTPIHANQSNDSHYCQNIMMGEECDYNIADEFIAWDKLEPFKQGLLTNYLFVDQAPADLATLFATWTTSHDDMAAAFLTITNALEHTEFYLGANNTLGFPATQLLVKINALAGDRIYVQLDSALMDQWMKAGGNFCIHRVDNKSECGNFNFDHGDWGGSLHSGFDTQGYTSRSKAPRIQINYRYSDSAADIDLDVAGWIWGFIPNPNHLTYQGSDTRQFYDSYIKKYGDPGYQPREYIVTAQ